MRSKLLRLTVGLPLVLVLGAGALVGAALLLVPAVDAFGPMTAGGACVHHISLQPLAQRSYVYDRAGTLLQTLFSDEDRDPVKLADVPAPVVDAVLATEDREFFQHSGVDMRGMMRALQRDVAKGGIREGGSTITQQLVKNTLFPNGRKRTAKDKIREITLAACLEKQYTKQQILERYLNTVYFGQRAYGLKAAAERYFGKPRVQDLTIPEAALLAGLIANPSRDPITHPNDARDRRIQVFQFMEATGAITENEAEQFARVPLPKATHPLTASQPNDYFAASVDAYLTDGENDASRSLGRTSDERRRLLYHGGLRITTTYDPALEKMAKAAKDAEGLPSRLRVGMAVVENSTGAVRAMLAGDDFSTNQFNLATQASQQPGSSFKTFTLTTAIERGYSPQDSINGSRTCTFDPPLSTTHYTVTAHAAGVGSLRTMISQSINCAFVRLIISLGHGAEGPRRVIELANRLGVRDIESRIGVKVLEPKLGENTSLTLGTSLVTPLDLATAYSTLASDGVRHDPTFVTRIVGPDGTVLYDRLGTTGRAVLSPQVARTVTDMLQGVITSGTARGYGNIGRPAAGKTGTTDDSNVVTFAGYTPQYTAVVMVYDGECRRLNADDTKSCALTRTVDIGGRQRALLPKGPDDAFGGHLSARIWATFMKAALADQPVVDFVAPDKSLWSRATYVDENGRRRSRGRPSGSGSGSSSGPSSGQKDSTSTTSGTAGP